MAFKPGQSGNLNGRPRGGKNKKTIEKELALEELRQTVLAELAPVIRGAIDSARGLTVMYQRKKVKVGKEFKREGELVQVTDQYRVMQLLEGSCEGDDWYYITTKDPNIQALKELLDRTFGKSKESLDITSDGKPIITVLKYAKGDNPTPPIPTEKLPDPPLGGV